MFASTETRWLHGLRHISSGAVMILMIAALLLAAPVAAHPPTAMDISYDFTTAKISVTITHPVDDPATHYLKTVRVKLNGDVISDPDYKSQLTKDTFTLTYDVNAHAGDVIDVTAICSRTGTLEKSYKIPEPARVVTSPQVPSTYVRPPATATQQPTAKSSPGLLPLLGAAAIIAIRRK